MRSFLLIFVAIAAVNFQVRAASSDLELEFPTPQQTPQVSPGLAPFAAVAASLIWRRRFASLTDSYDADAAQAQMENPTTTTQIVSVI